MKRFFCRVIFAICLGVSGFAHASTISVSPSGVTCTFPTPPTQDCDLQSALDFAEESPGDDDLVLSAGVYDASLATFEYSPSATQSGGLTLTGAGAIIDGGGSTGQAGMDINLTTLNSDASSNIVVANLTFRNGATTTVDAAGLSVNARDASINIHHCSFINNENTGSGAGGLNIGKNGTIGSVTVAKNNFSGNRTDGLGGGALIASEGSLSILGNTFTNNQAMNGSPGGGLTIESEGTLLMDGNKFQDNVAESGGGGAFVEAENETGGSVIITNNIFMGNGSNSTNADPFEEGGGALFLLTEGGEINLINNTFVDNQVLSGNAGGVKIFLDSEGFVGATNFYNNIFFNNSATGSSCPGSCQDIFVDDVGEGLLSGPEVNVFNNLYSDISFSCLLSNGCVPHQNVDVVTNIDADPLFVNSSGGDFRLKTGSPAIDAGSASAPHLPSNDFQGSNRIQGANPDMGALESTPAPVPPPGPENCANNVDDDKDGKIDCNDPDCAGAAACQNPPSPSSENCANGSDDDGDGQADCDDPDCSGAFACLDDQTPSPGSENCANDVDDDGDGNIDCNDPDCSGAAACRSQTGGTGGTPSNISVQSGCSLGMGSGNPSSVLWLFAPLLLTLTRRIMRLKVKGITFLFLALLFLGFSHPSQAADFDVSSGGSNDCVNSPPCNLQIALDTAAANGEDDTLNLSEGTYDASSGAFNYKPIENKTLTLIGQGMGSTVVDGGGVEAGMILDTTANIVGTDSMADITVRDIGFQNGQTATSAGGLSILTDDADIIVRNCNFRFNNSDVPVGGFDFGGGGLSTVAKDLGSVTITDSVFFRNSVTQSIGGGSLAVSVNGNVSLEGNTYLENTTLDLLGPSNNAIAGGAAVVSVVGSLSVNRNLFLDNSSQGGAGLLAVEVFGNGVITNNIAARNLAAGSTGSGGGTGIFPAGGGMLVVAVQGKIDVTNNTIVENQSAAEGGGILVTYDSDGGEINLFNNIIRGNLGQAGTVCTTGCDDIVFVDDDDGNNIGSKANVSHNDFGTLFFQCQEDQGCTPNQNVDAASNINADPLFANLGLSNFHLLAGSPAIDKGTASAPSLPAKDFDLKTRNQGTAPDMGALESIPPPPTPPTPPTTENCANGLDDDQDNAVDCSDSDCSGAAACRNTTPPPSGPENCTNNVDDDGDTNIDCNDPDCSGSAACQSPTPPPPAGNSENCANGADDDGDTQVDCDDPDCSGAASCLEDTGGGSQSPSNIDVNSGCVLGAGTGSPSSLFCLLIPLFLAAGRFVGISKSSRGR